MNTLITLAAVSGILTQFLYVILFIAMLGVVIWAINTYIHPIPPPILMIIALVLIIAIAIWFLQGRGM